MLSDAAYMDRALSLAARATGGTTPNPLVGAVVVSPDGVVIGQGYHARAGEPHAEVHALCAAGLAARNATLYCTLEPCSHHGRTPPCVGRILDAGIARVVMAVGDPNPRVAGAGVRALRDAGVRVDTGVGRIDAVVLNQPFFSVMRRGRPWVVVKIATSLDGRVAAGIGLRTRLTSPAADRRNQVWRASVDAIGVGSETVLVDDPLLTARDVYRCRPLARVIFDRRLRTPPGARMLSTLADGPVYVVTTRASVEANAGHARALESAGATLVTLDRAGLQDALPVLVGLQIHALLIEGGPALHEAAWRAGLVDEVRVMLTPRALGPAGVPWVPAHVAPLTALRHVRIEPCGPDVIIEGYVHRID
ncbi:MAG: bifunctional diaminohydroxyphosphoribosylaminopyrimidine deaminase/5-amino-6-(5-phosphoribosylamino)uracil reductase RibD [Acidobacteriota bacterium]